MNVVKEAFIAGVCASKAKHIGFIVAVDNRWASEIYKGLVKRIRLKPSQQAKGMLGLRISTMSSQNDTAQLERNLDKLIASGCQAIISVGSWASTHVAQIAMRKKYKIDHFFCGVNDPAALNMFGIPGVRGTGGCNKGGNHDKRVSALLSISPEIKVASLIKVVHPGKNQNITEFLSLAKTDVDRDYASLRSAFEAVGITVIETPLDLTQPIAEQLVKADVICVFREVTRLNYLNDLIEFVTKHKVPLYAAEKESVLQGAALGYGDSGYDYGHHLGQMIYDYITEQIEYKEIKSLVFDSPGTLHINLKALKSQGLDISTEQIRKLTDSVF